MATPLLTQESAATGWDRLRGLGMRAVLSHYMCSDERANLVHGLGGFREKRSAYGEAMKQPLPDPQCDIHACIFRPFRKTHRVIGWVRTVESRHTNTPSETTVSVPIGTTTPHVAVSPRAA